ncbi:MAG: 50S ribosomal protein L4 [Thermoplasmata archaeon]
MTTTSPRRPHEVEHPPPHPRAPVVALDGSSTEHVQLPLAFSEPVRPDLIRRAVLAARANRRQAYGTSPTAGLRHSVQWSGKGKGVSRTPRLMDSMRGAQAPNTVGGRPAHPPRPDRIWTLKINTKERKKAFASALAATREEKLARARGHAIPDGLALPVILEPGIESIRETQEALSLLDRLRLASDVERAREHSHLRAGRGKRRGRVRRTPRSLLVVTAGRGQASGFRNLPGVDVVDVHRLTTEDLAPGGDPGRVTIFSRAALSSLAERLEGHRP